MSAQEESKVEVKKPSRALTGIVVSSKMDKTIAVEIERLIKHPRYGKFIAVIQSCWPTTRTRKPARRHRVIAPCVRCRAQVYKWSRSFRRRAPKIQLQNHAHCADNSGAARDVHQGVGGTRRRYAQAATSSGVHRTRCRAARSRRRGVMTRRRSHQAWRTPRRWFAAEVRYERGGAPDQQARAGRHAHLRTRHARAAHRAVHEDRLARA